MPRCKACNSVLHSKECEWIEELQMHEDMCYMCRAIVIECECEEAFSVFDDNESDDTILIKAVVDEHD